MSVSDASSAKVKEQVSDRVPPTTLVAYCLAILGAGYMNPTVNALAMKFATDALLIAPAIMGLIFSASRILDAVSDPLLGYLCDRTSNRFGRRRTWLLAGGIPLVIAFTMIFTPPGQLHGAWLVAWMAVAVIGYHFSLGAFMIPHYSLGAELSDNYHEKSRVFAGRQAAWAAGAVMATMGLYVVIAASLDGPGAMRDVVGRVALVASLTTFALIIYSVTVVKEPAVHRPAKAVQLPTKALKDVWRNSHARLLLVVFFIESIGFGAVGALSLYITQYVVGRPELAVPVFLFYLVPAAALVQLWVKLSRRVGKKRVWIAAMLVSAASLGVTVVLPFLSVGPASWLLVTAVFFAGAAAGCGNTMAPSILGDIVDVDEHHTGERKQGTYYAALLFAQKTGYGVMMLLTGFVLQWTGFMPNVDQSIKVKLGIVFLFGFMPLVCYLVGALMFSRFGLDEEGHSTILAKLRSRNL
jgi:glycoside/pentoside/hexuronide:cation symporter, GPH family